MKRWFWLLMAALLLQTSFSLANEDREKDKEGKRGQAVQRKMNNGRKGNRVQPIKPQNPRTQPKGYQNQNQNQRRQQNAVKPGNGQAPGFNSKPRNGVDNGRFDSTDNGRHMGQQKNNQNGQNGGGNNVSTGRNNGNNWNNGRSNRSGRNFNRNVPGQLKRIGIRSYPHPITERNHILTTDREHSSITYPRTGMGGASLHATVFSRNNISSPVVRTHMNMVVSANFTTNVASLNVNETRVNNYYWHSYNGFNYCHYYDHWGYHWYGWYVGSNCFWTRYYYNNWWWYDPVYYRWCYWHDGGWWWQDPYHVNTVYVYVNGNYQATQAGSDTTTTLASPSDSSAQVFRSPDGTRMVKVTGNGQDAFLYDTTDDPSFQPLYLASGVKEVKLSNTNNGRPLQVMLILNDGSFDLFDDQGNPFNGGNSGNGGSSAPPNAGNPPNQVNQ